MKRFQDVEILGREVPFFDSLTHEEQTPASAVVGSIDLIYRDGEDVIVVDYKTDRVFSEEDIQARASKYATQGYYYCQAVKTALGLDTLPPFELWFLLPGKAIRSNDI